MTSSFAISRPSWWRRTALWPWPWRKVPLPAWPSSTRWPAIRGLLAGRPSTSRVPTFWGDLVETRKQLTPTRSHWLLNRRLSSALSSAGASCRSGHARPPAAEPQLCRVAVQVGKCGLKCARLLVRTDHERGGIARGGLPDRRPVWLAHLHRDDGSPIAARSAVRAHSDNQAVDVLSDGPVQRRGPGSAVAGVAAGAPCRRLSMGAIAAIATVVQLPGITKGPGAMD